MNSTQFSLLQRAGTGDETAWRRIVEVYSPLIRVWLIGRGVSAQDADDLVQDVMAIVVRKLPEFEHAGRPGSFRAWLRTVAVHRVQRFFESGRCRVGTASGGSEFLEYLGQLEDSTSDAAAAWDAVHDRYVFRRLLTFMESEFEPQTVLVFRRLVIDEAKPAEVATETGLSIAAVYGAKSRVLARLRQEAAGMLE